MAIATLLALLPQVHVIYSMAVYAARAHFDVHSAVTVTAFTGKLIVLSTQVKLSITIMVESGFDPQLYRVTTFAFFAILTIMLIVVFMAVYTKGADFLIKPRLLMAGVTG
jgi:hypothetical protein